MVLMPQQSTYKRCEKNYEITTAINCCLQNMNDCGPIHTRYFGTQYFDKKNKKTF
jgi:hypothetical protein